MTGMPRSNGFASPVVQIDARHRLMHPVIQATHRTLSSSATYKVSGESVLSFRPTRQVMQFACSEIEREKVRASLRSIQSHFANSTSLLPSCIHATRRADIWKPRHGSLLRWFVRRNDGANCARSQVTQLAYESHQHACRVLTPRTRHPGRSRRDIICFPGLGIHQMIRCSVPRVLPTQHPCHPCDPECGSRH